MIYGANGYTGRLVSELARSRGEQPILAGRTTARISPLATSFGLEHRIVDLSDDKALRDGLRGVDVVVHCAGPFSRTAAPMVEACLEAGTHYVDVTGEIDVFEHVASRDEAAREAGIALMPGSGFDVAPSDCLAAMLVEALPGAVQLELAFVLDGGLTAGTAKTVVENMGRGSRVRVDGQLRPVRFGWRRRRVPFPNGERTAVVAIPWGDISTAYRTTGIPTITAFSALPAARLNARLQAAMSPIMRPPRMQRLAVALIERLVSGPDAPKRARNGVEVWGEVRDAAGRTATAAITGPNAYTVTADSVLRIVRHLLDGDVKPGVQTASTALGADYLRELEGFQIHEPVLSGN
ncbi:saccharopine dehydrogenase family protein [Qaidamihabitans albus]|uniref:saccharopine dehydrogenase family protein n=1 Tax=Qaidamihabitans albus TaxID=2795733 RepID=UPI001F400FD0|nr:saccharopine dehydrogenase NADP-binding domain-containing protein [Qaidamihabitans albus]